MTTRASTIPIVRRPASSLLVPDNAPSLLWRHLSQHRSDAAQRNLVAGVTSVPFAWDECSDWLSALTAQLNRVVSGAAPAAAAVETSEAEGAAAAAAAAPTTAAAAAAPTSDAAAAPAAAVTAPRIKCSLESCQVYASGDRALQVCARCSSARYCSREHQSQDWPHHKLVCRKPPSPQLEVQVLKQICCTQLMQLVLNAELALSFALLRQRHGDGALFVAMRDFLHLSQDTPDAAEARQIWVSWLTLPELLALKAHDARLSDVAVAVQETAAAAAGTAAPRDFYFFADDAGFSLCIGAPRYLVDAQRAAVVAAAAPELQASDLFVVDLPTQRRFACRFTNIEVQIKEAMAGAEAAESRS